MEKAVEQRGTGWKRGDRIIRSESGYFFSFIRSVPSLWQLRAIYVTAKLSLLMRFFRPRARARDFDPIWTLVPASTHPKSEMPESIMLVYRHASSINPRIFQSHAFLHLHVHRRQRTTTTTRKVNVRQTVFQRRPPRKSRPKKASSNLLSLRVVC